MSAKLELTRPYERQMVLAYELGYDTTGNLAHPTEVAQICLAARPLQRTGKRKSVAGITVYG